MAVGPVPTAASHGGWDASPNAQPQAGSGKPTLSKGHGLYWGMEPPELAPGHTVTCGRAWGSARPAWALPLSPRCEGPAGAVCWRAVTALQLCGCPSSSQSKLGGPGAGPECCSSPRNCSWRYPNHKGLWGSAPLMFCYCGASSKAPSPPCCNQCVGPRGFSLGRMCWVFTIFIFLGHAGSHSWVA